MQGGVWNLQGYLAHKKTPTPYDPFMALRIGLRWGPRGVRVLISEVPLYVAGQHNASPQDSPLLEVPGMGWDGTVGDTGRDRGGGRTGRGAARLGGVEEEAAGTLCEKGVSIKSCGDGVCLGEGSAELLGGWGSEERGCDLEIELGDELHTLSSSSSRVSPMHPAPKSLRARRNAPHLDSLTLSPPSSIEGSSAVSFEGSSALSFDAYDHRRESPLSCLPGEAGRVSGAEILRGYVQDCAGESGDPSLAADTRGDRSQVSLRLYSGG